MPRTRTAPPMTPMRKTALAAGILYLVTFVTSIPALQLYDGVLNTDGWILGAGGAGGVTWGAFLEVILGLACIGTAVTLYPVARRHSETAALSFVTTRLLEASMIFVGVVSLLSVLTLRDDVAGTAGADPAALTAVGQGLVAVHDWTFLLGPGFMAGMNGLALGYVMYRSGLVPRIIPTVGLIGAPILLASCTATLFGVYDQISGWATLAALPIASWELSLGIWMTVKGFRTAPSDACSGTARERCGRPRRRDRCFASTEAGSRSCPRTRPGCGFASSRRTRRARSGWGRPDPAYGASARAVSCWPP